MIMPTKIVKPVDSLLSISSVALKVVSEKKMAIDDLLEEVNNLYYKKITMEKLMLCLNFLYITGKVESTDEAITATFG